MVNMHVVLVEQQRIIQRYLDQVLRRRRRRAVWVRGWLQRRPILGQYATLIEELRLEDANAYLNYMRVPPQLFDEICRRISHRIRPNERFVRTPLEDGLKLAATLRHLASGDTYTSMQYNFRVHRTTLGYWIPRVCQAIVDEFAEEYLKCPDTPEAWLAVEEEFRTRWNVPHAIGALDGKHVAIRCPRRGGSIYYNYKGFHSIILFALVDADYKFLWVDVGTNGACSDSQIMNDTVLKRKIEDGSIGRPGAAPIIPDGRKVEYFFLGDDAFALKSWLMKPYSLRQMTRDQRVYNYRISRGRRIVENAFGLLAQRFLVLLRTIPQGKDVVV